ncbi:MAG: DUF1670 domain-containing protein [Chloroflexota bacterium]|nr:DUF1670 domain-containing protein [Chloroflexota bacterium]
MRCLTSLAAIAPLLLVLEDLHWADEATLVALPYLAPRLPDSRVFLILTCRTTAARARPAVWESLRALDRALPFLRLRLTAFERAEVITLVQRALGASGTDASATAFARRLQDETGGNALFLVETFKSLLEQGALVPTTAGDWVLPSSDLPLPTPTSIRELVAERVGRLAPALRAVLELAAVLGEDADFAVLSQVSSLSPANLACRLETLCQQGFLVDTNTGYRFEHDLTQEVIYQALAPERLRTLHRQVGTVLEELSPERVESLARHFDQGNVRDKALTHTLRAGELAWAVCDYERTLAYYRRALVLADDSLAVRWDLLNRQERALDVLSRREVQNGVLDEMLHLAVVLDDPVRQASTYHSQGWLEVLSGKPVRALSLLDKAAALARAAGERDLLGDCLTSAARAWWRIGDVAHCQAAIEEAWALFQETGNRRNEIRVLNMLGNLHLGLTGQYAQALAYFEENQRAAYELGDRYQEAAAQANVGITCSLLGCYGRSQEELAGAYQVMASVGDHNWQGIIRRWQGANCRGLGELDQAQVMGEEALAICWEVSNHNFEIAALDLLGQVALERHTPEQAGLYFQQAIVVAQANQQTMDQALQQAHLALAYLYRGHLEEAHRLSEQASAMLAGRGEQFSYMKEIYFMRYQIIAAVEGAEAAQPYLEQAYRALQAMAADIDNLDLRHSFLENITVNRDIVATHRLGYLPTPLRRQTMRLPAAGAPTGRPLRDNEYIEVTWTIAAPEDDELIGKITRRRHRILRLLQEAQKQAAAPTVAHLAEALKVGERTIKRDLAALRAAGHAVRTRGSHR